MLILLSSLLFLTNLGISKQYLDHKSIILPLCHYDVRLALIWLTFLHGPVPNSDILLVVILSSELPHYPRFATHTSVHAECICAMQKQLSDVKGKNQGLATDCSSHQRASQTRTQKNSSHDEDISVHSKKQLNLLRPG